MGLISSCLIAVVLLGLLVLWLRTRAASAYREQDPPAARRFLSDLHLELPPRAVRERIFDSSDWEFVSSQAPYKTQKLFLEERKRLARLWLFQTRAQVRQLLRIHALRVRSDIRLQPVREIQLALGYLSFAACHWTLRCLIVMKGSFAARRVLNLVSEVAEHYWATSARVMESINPQSIDKIRADWARESRLS